MELRKDPITRSWVAVGHPERAADRTDPCPLCPENRIETHTLLAYPPEGKWKVRAFPHLRPVYRVEGEAGRIADGIYDRMSGVGAHEIIVETPEHGVALEDLPDENIQLTLEAYAARITDLKKDSR